MFRRDRRQRAGRRYARAIPGGSIVDVVSISRGPETLLAVSVRCPCEVVPVDEIKLLSVQAKVFVNETRPRRDRVARIFKAVRPGDRDLLTNRTIAAAKKTISTAENNLHEHLRVDAGNRIAKERQDR